MRETFGLGLPHVGAIKKWYNAIDGSAGFRREAFGPLGKKVSDARSSGDEVLCALMIDKMAIRKHVDWDGKKMVAYVYIGISVSDNTAPYATEALVFYVRCSQQLMEGFCRLLFRPRVVRERKC